jgi:hypothetical protein
MRDFKPPTVPATSVSQHAARARGAVLQPIGAETLEPVQYHQSEHCNLSVHEWIARPRAMDPDLPTQYKVSKMCLLEGDR